ncbi:hypothetical protein BH09VER1_BH09VER1_18500 [soil metagenome]
MNARKRVLIDCLVLLVCLASLSWACWNLPVGRADESGFIARAAHIAHGDSFSTNTFFLFYAGLFRFVTSDPLLVHLFGRLAVSVLSTFAIYFVLRAFRPWLSDNAILVSSIIWTSTYLCFPFLQLGTISLFGYSLGIFGLGFILRGCTLPNFLLCEAFIFLGAQARKELWIPLLLFGAVFVLTMLLHPGKRSALLKSLKSPAVLILLVLFVALGAVFFFRKAETLSNSKHHSLLAFGQSYARFVSQTEHRKDFDPMSEYLPILNERFNHPESVLDAIKAHPGEVARFFVLNSLMNLRELPMCFFSTRDTGTQSSIFARPNALLIALSLGLGGLLGLWSLRQADWPSWFRPVEGGPSLSERFLYLLLFAATSGVAFIMVTYVSRHYIPLAPLAFLLLAWCWQQILSLALVRKIPAPALIFIVAVIFCRPGLAPAQDWNADLRALREARPLLPAKPVIAGINSAPFITYGLDGQGIEASPMSTPILSADALLRGDYDVFLLNGNLRGTSIWNKQQPQFEAFIAQPEKFGYHLWRDIRHGSCLIYLRQPKGAS